MREDAVERSRAVDFRISCGNLSFGFGGGLVDGFGL